MPLPGFGHVWVYHAVMGVNVLFSRIFYDYMGAAMVPYLGAWTLLAGVVCRRGGWQRHVLWLHVYATLAAQAMCDALGLLLSQGFGLYAMVPLALCGVFETVTLVTMATPAARAHLAWCTQPRTHSHSQDKGPHTAGEPPWHVRFMVHLYLDEDVRQWYAVLFEVYMTVCSCVLCLRSSFMRAECGGVIFAVLTGLVLLASEDMRDTRAAQDLRLPSPAVKAVYVLYTPMRFLCAAHFVAALALFASKPHPVQNNDTLIAIYSPHTLGGIVAMVGVASIFFANELDTCPVERL
jgi:hypothetical protein